jgi:acyl-coenzyme A thioesterase PaaI-like protein
MSASPQTPSKRSRLVEWEDPAPYVQRGMTISPLEYLSQLVSGEIPKSPIGELMNIWGVEIEAGRAVFAAEPGEEHYNPVGVVHGGFLATLLD